MPEKRLAKTRAAYQPSRLSMRIIETYNITCETPKRVPMLIPASLLEPGPGDSDYTASRDWIAREHAYIANVEADNQANASNER